MVIKYSLSDFDDEQLFSMCGITFTFIQDDGLRFRGTLDDCNTHRRPPRVLIDGDMRLPISLFKYIESEVDLFLMFKNDTPSQINEPLKLNWRDAKKELPVKDGIMQKLCIVRIKYTNGIDELCKATVYDWYNDTAEIDENTGEYIGKWLENDGEVTHWIYVDEIPLPEE